MVKFSVVIPIYNVEPFLEECIDSVLAQKFDSYEIILVNDGSTDSSGEICKKYLQKNSNIIYIKSSNQGVSSARNQGINIANGEFIVFLDSDDLFSHSNVLSIMNKFIEKDDSDILIFDYRNYDGQNKIGLMSDFRNKYLKNENIEKTLENILLDKNKCMWSPWRSIFKKSIIQKWNLQFDITVLSSEDCKWFIDFLKVSKKISFVNEVIVDYRINREGSLTYSPSFEKVKSQLKVFSELFHEFKSEDSPKLGRYFAAKYMNVLSELKNIQKIELKQIENNFYENKEMFKYLREYKYKIFNIAIKTLGFKNGTRFILCLREILKRGR